MGKDTKILHREIAPDKFTHKDAARAVRIWEVVHTDEGGYVPRDYDIHVWANGDFTISDNDGEGFISMRDDIAKLAVKFLTGQPLDTRPER